MTRETCEILGFLFAVTALLVFALWLLVPKDGGEG